MSLCLILLAYKCHPQYPLIIAANRDEFYSRPTERAQFWLDHPMVFGGRDLEKMGTWLGVTKSGRFAAVTNYRNPSMLIEEPYSRGGLVSDFLNSAVDPLAYLSVIKEKRARYNPFNLIIGELPNLLYYSQVTNQIAEIGPGVHGLSNHLLNTPWPKVKKSTTKLTELLRDTGEIDPDRIFEILADSQRADLQELPDTGVDIEWEQVLSSIFVSSPTYGTRNSTIVLMDGKGSILFIERSFIPGQSMWKEAAYRINKST